MDFWELGYSASVLNQFCPWWCGQTHNTCTTINNRQTSAITYVYMNEIPGTGRYNIIVEPTINLSIMVPPPSTTTAAGMGKNCSSRGTTVPVLR